MREILFKAKRADSGEWVEGFYLYADGTTFIGVNVVEHYCTPAISWVKVGPRTVCQFTGLTDKNGKRIWENDITWVVYDGNEHIYQIVWDDSELGFKVTNGKENYGSDFEYLSCCDEIEVRGNIFDNPELLQEVHQNEQS